ncbi:MAG: hypothetical protein IKG18_04120 [Atopobiaceae bacterium]|nr:hypothetical protein [Atopobiaceae bacterium]
MRTTRKEGARTRSVAAWLLSFVLVLGCVPTEALAEALDQDLTNSQQPQGELTLTDATDEVPTNEQPILSTDEADSEGGLPGGEETTSDDSGTDTTTGNETTSDGSGTDEETTTDESETDTTTSDESIESLDTVPNENEDADDDDQAANVENAMDAIAESEESADEHEEAYENALMTESSQEAAATDETEPVLILTTMSTGEAGGEGETEPSDLADASINVSNQTYTGKAIEPEVIVTLDGKTLEAGTDYTLTFKNNVKVGTATVTVKAAGTYTGTTSATFQIEAASLKEATITGVKSTQTYTGKAIEPTPTVKLDGTTLKAGTDYTVSYKSHKNVGTATVSIAGKGNYTGTTTATFAITAAPISKARAAKLKNQPFTGKARKPTVSLTYGGAKLKAGRDYTVSYKNNTKAGTATITVTGKGNFSGTRALTFKIVKPSLSYMVHVQNVGDQAWRKDGKVAGTTKQGKRLEAVRIKLASGFPVTGGITYRTHIQDIGWQSWRSNGKESGTRRQSKRIEAIQIKLTGQMAKKYNVWYRTHAQNVGWTAWAKNGQSSGTMNMAWRLEAMQVVILPKGSSAPGRVQGIASKVKFRALNRGGVTYRAFVTGQRWQDWKKAGQTSGTTGDSRRVEAVEAKLYSKSSLAPAGSIVYRTYLQDEAWTDWVTDGAKSGKGGRRVEAVQFKLRGQAAKYEDIWYRAYVQGLGWLGWAKNGKAAGTKGASRRLEAYQIRILPKGSAAPGSTAERFLTGDDIKRKAEEEAIRIEQSDPVYWDAQGYYSPTSWLLMVNCTECSLTILKGSQGNWHKYDKYLVGVGRWENPSKHGVWSVGARGYSFGGHDYTCYYWVQYYNDYLFHTVPCWAGTFDIKDGRLGEHVSAGCVRQPFDKAIWLYENIPSGTTVVVYD